eukprot:COSAG06_NODE_571_length_14101_cov_12.481682_5_plen_148_part_00
MIVVPVRCPHAPTACKMASLIRVVKSEHDSIGGTVLGHISSMPIGLGEPCFDKLEVSNRSAETSYHACVLQCSCVQMMRQMDAENPAYRCCVFCVVALISQLPVVCSLGKACARDAVAAGDQGVRVWLGLCRRKAARLRAQRRLRSA